MKTKPRLFTLLILGLLLVPMVNAFTIDGPTNFENSHGGIVRYDITPTITQIGIVNTLIRFTNLRTGAVNLGNLGFDAATGVNMTITQINLNTVSYTVETALPGVVNTYIYYRRNLGTAQITRPVTVTGGLFTYAPATGTATISTTGAAVNVVVTYGMDVGSNLVDGSNLIWLLMPFLILVLAVKDYQAGSFGVDTLYKIIFTGMMIAFMSWLFNSWGY